NSLLGRALESLAASVPLAVGGTAGVRFRADPSAATLLELIAAHRAALVAAARGAGPALWNEEARVGQERVSSYQLLAALAEVDGQYAALLRNAVVVPC
ncbi:MAG TPA: hypothetical protein VF541_09240, partial [Longimicrobium sp.]